MLLALGLRADRPGDRIARVDAHNWIAFPRDRILLSTLPVESTDWTPARRPPPWEQGWSPHPAGQMQPMMRHRQILGNDIIGSAYQYS
eukprot:10981517-Lingulodinium_polyedra.AAC.1